MCDECTWHHKTFLVQLYWHLPIKLYGIVLLLFCFFFCRMGLNHQVDYFSNTGRGWEVGGRGGDWGAGLHGGSSNCSSSRNSSNNNKKLLFLQQASATAAAATTAAEAAATTKKLLFLQQALDTKTSTVLAAVVFVPSMSSRQLRILSPHHHRLLLPLVAAHLHLGMEEWLLCPLLKVWRPSSVTDLLRLLMN